MQKKAAEWDISVAAPAILYKGKQSIICFSWRFFSWITLYFLRNILCLLHHGETKESEKTDWQRQQAEAVSSRPTIGTRFWDRTVFLWTNRKRKGFRCLCTATGKPCGKSVQGTSVKSTFQPGFWFCLLGKTLLWNKAGYQCAAHTSSLSSPHFSCTEA